MMLIFSDTVPAVSAFMLVLCRVHLEAINPTTSERSDGEAVDCDAGGDDGGNEDVDGGGGGDGGGSGGGGGGADGAECKPKL